MKELAPISGGRPAPPCQAPLVVQKRRILFIVTQYHLRPKYVMCVVYGFWPLYVLDSTMNRLNVEGQDIPPRSATELLLAAWRVDPRVRWNALMIILMSVAAVSPLLDPKVL